VRSRAPRVLRNALSVVEREVFKTARASAVAIAALSAVEVRSTLITRVAALVGSTDNTGVIHHLVTSSTGFAEGVLCIAHVAVLSDVPSHIAVVAALVLVASNARAIDKLSILDTATTSISFVVAERAISGILTFVATETALAVAAENTL